VRPGLQNQVFFSVPYRLHYQQGNKMSNQSKSQLPNGTLLNDTKTGAVYLIREGMKWHVPDPATFNRMGLDWGAIRDASDDELSQIPDERSNNASSQTPDRSEAIRNIVNAAEALVECQLSSCG
jgi:hypothetical protein